jgi:hypothetical protein
MQRDLVVAAALALCRLFYVEGELLEKVNRFVPISWADPGPGQ